MNRRSFAVPPGRAGRLWLQRRLRTAERGADLLDRKLRILQWELGGLRAGASRAAAEWDRCCADAQRWLLRASMLGGERAVRVAADGLFADVTISYSGTVGVRHPVGATCVIPAPATWDGPGLAAARQAHRTALAAAVRYAAAAEALRIIEAETLATRHRLRAIRDRWIPQLEDALAEVTLAIEEQERADAARLRLATGVGGIRRQARRLASPVMRRATGGGINGPGQRHLAIHGVLHRPDGGRQFVEPAQATPQAWGAAAARGVDRFVGRVREPSQPRPQERLRRWLAAPVSRRGKRAADSRLRLGEDRVRRVAHLGDDLPSCQRVRFALRHRAQPAQVRMAARLLIMYLVGESHDPHPLC